MLCILALEFSEKLQIYLLLYCCGDSFSRLERVKGCIHVKFAMIFINLCNFCVDFRSLMK